jgi:uncharacterized membrane protein YgcG
LVFEDCGSNAVVTSFCSLGEGVSYVRDSFFLRSYSTYTGYADGCNVVLQGGDPAAASGRYRAMVERCTFKGGTTAFDVSRSIVKDCHFTRSQAAAFGGTVVLDGPSVYSIASGDMTETMHDLVDCGLGTFGFKVSEPVGVSELLVESGVEPTEDTPSLPPLATAGLPATAAFSRSANFVPSSGIGASKSQIASAPQLVPNPTPAQSADGASGGGAGSSGAMSSSVGGGGAVSGGSGASSAGAPGKAAGSVGKGSTGMIIGIVFGVLILAIIAAILIWLFLCRRRTAIAGAKKEEEEEHREKASDRTQDESVPVELDEGELEANQVSDGEASGHSDPAKDGEGSAGGGTGSSRGGEAQGDGADSGSGGGRRTKKAHRKRA